MTKTADPRPALVCARCPVRVEGDTWEACDAAMVRHYAQRHPAHRYSKDLATVLTEDVREVALAEMEAALPLDPCHNACPTCGYPIRAMSPAALQAAADAHKGWHQVRAQMAREVLN